MHRIKDVVVIHLGRLPSYNNISRKLCMINLRKTLQETYDANTIIINYKRKDPACNNAM